MDWLERVRQLPDRQKSRIIYAVCAVAVILLGLLWYFTSKIGKDLPKDRTFIDVAKESYENLGNAKQNNPKQ